MSLQNSTNPKPLFDFLNEQKIPYQRMDHDPVYTVEESKKLNLGLEGGATKNLFLRDKKGKRHFLFCVEQSKQVDLKKVPALVESSKFELCFTGTFDETSGYFAGLRKSACFDQRLGWTGGGPD